MKTSSRKNDSAAEPQPTANSVGAIRDILFGEQMNDYAERFGELEKQLTNEIARVEHKFDKHIADLKALLQKESDNLGDAKVGRSQLAAELQRVVDHLEQGSK